MAKGFLDQRAKRLLFDTFWTSTGWRKIAHIAPDDLAYAKSKGFMFDTVTMSHDQVIRWALDARETVTSTTVVAAFLASLTTRRLDLRSALGSYAVVRHIRDHAFEERPGAFRCRICGVYNGRSGIDLNVLNFERYKWGGVRHDQPQYAAFDLEQLSLAEFNPPTSADLAVLKKIIDTASSMPDSARLRDLSKALAPLLPSSDQERRVLISILGYCGILVDPKRPGFRTSFTPYEHREHTTHAKDDWPYPVQWWKGRFGVDEVAVADWFSATWNA